MPAEQTSDLSGTTIGFIGLGLMGEPMATNLQKAGAKLAVPRRSTHAIGALDPNRVEIFDTPAEITRAADLVILMLPDAETVRTVCHDSDGVLAAAGANTTVMDMGTTDPETTAGLIRSLQKIGGNFVDAPVTGGRMGASAGNLTIFVGVDSKETHDQVRPVLDVMGGNITQVGKAGSGQAAKAINQLLNFSTQTIVAEAMALARRSGLDLNTLIPAMAGGAGDSFILKVLGPRMAAEDWSITAHMKIAVKDLDIVLETAGEHGLELKMTELARSRWLDASRAIGPERDIAEYVRFVDPDFSGGGWNQKNDAIGSGRKK